MSDTALIIGKLRRIRRRLFFLRLAGSAGVACCIFGVLGVLFTFESLRFYRSPGLWLGLLGVGLAVATLVFSVLGMPSHKETVRRVDRRLGLQQRLETAWECLTPREDIDRIILMDAGRRMATISPAAVVPFRVNRTTGILLTIGLLSFTTLSLIQLLDGSGPLKLSSFGNLPHPAAENTMEPGAGSDKTSEGNRDFGTPPGPPDPGSAAVRNAAAVPRNSIEEMSNDAVLQASPPATGNAGGAEALPFNRAESPSAVFPFQQAPGNTSAPADRPPDRNGTEDSRQGKTLPDSVKNREATDDSLPYSSGTSGRGKTGDSDGASAGTQTPQAADETGAIPAAGKTALPEDADPSVEKVAISGNTYPSDYASLRIAAERAIAREKIPPGLKKYIADYFRAIQP